MGDTVNLGALGDGVYIVQQGTIVEVLKPKEYGQIIDLVYSGSHYKKGRFIGKVKISNKEKEINNICKNPLAHLR